MRYMSLMRQHGMGLENKNLDMSMFHLSNQPKYPCEFISKLVLLNILKLM